MQDKYIVCYLMPHYNILILYITTLAACLIIFIAFFFLAVMKNKNVSWKLLS